MDELSGGQSVVGRWRSLSREQKVSLVILMACGVTAFVLSIQRVHSRVVDPFKVSVTQVKTAQDTLNKLDPTAADEARAKRMDTDGDGLSDWDESHAYRTSPYLRDTDGDGIPDNVEIAQGMNPNCPKGQQCVAQVLDTSAVASSSAILNPLQIQRQSPDQLYATFQQGSNVGRDQLKQQGATTVSDALVRDPASIRKALIQSGQVSEAQVNQMTDEQLYSIYDNAEAALQAQQQ